MAERIDQIDEIKGRCLCGAVHYGFAETTGVFQYCHCSRCRKFTGSVHGANIFVKPEHFYWRAGEQFVQRYFPEETKYFSTAFCKKCGSSLPWKNKSGTIVVIPVGTLDDDPKLQAQRNIFCASQVGWYSAAESLPKFDELPPRS